MDDTRGHHGSLVVGVQHVADSARGMYQVLDVEGGIVQLRRLLGDEPGRLEGPVNVRTERAKFASMARPIAGGTLEMTAPSWFCNVERRAAPRVPSNMVVQVLFPKRQSAIVQDISMNGCALLFEDLGTIKPGDHGRLSFRGKVVEFEVKNRRSGGHPLLQVAGVAFVGLSDAAYAAVGLEVARPFVDSGISGGTNAPDR